MKIDALMILVVITPLFALGTAAAQEVLNMRSIQEMCGPQSGHHNFVDQTECVMRVLPQSNNPELVPTDPYIGAYTQMAWRMIDDVRNNRISVVEARDNVRQSYYQVLTRQSQAARDQDDKETIERKQIRSVQDQENAEAEARDAAEARAAYHAEQDRDREKIRRALSTISNNLNSIAEAKQQRAESAGRTADEIGRMTSRYDAELTLQRAAEQQRIVEQHAPQIAEQRASAATRNLPTKSYPPLAPAPTPAQTAESRRAAGLPDDPSAAACIQDDDCAHAALPRH